MPLKIYDLITLTKFMSFLCQISVMHMNLNYDLPVSQESLKDPNMRFSCQMLFHLCLFQPQIEHLLCLHLRACNS